MFSISEPVSERLQPQRRGSLADHDVHLLTWDVLLAMLNLTRKTRVCVRKTGDDLLAAANYTCQRCVSLLLEQEVKVTPPGSRVTAADAAFGFTGNFYFSVSVSNRLSGALHPIMAGWILASSGAQLIWHWLHSGHLSRGTGEEMSLSIHRTDYFTREQKSSKADFHACANVVTGIWIWHELTEYWRSTSLKRCKHFLRYPGVIPSVCIVHFGKIETAVVQILNSSGLKGWTLNCPTLQKLSMLRSFFVHFWDFTGHKKTHKGGKKRKKRAKVICQTVNTSLLKHHVTRWPWTNKPRVARCRRV